MKQRLISSAAGLLLLAAVLLLFETVFPNIILTLVGGLCIFEALRAYNLNKHLLLLITLELAHAANMFLELDPMLTISVVIFSCLMFLVAADGAAGSFLEASAAAVLTLIVTSGLKALSGFCRFSPLTSDSMLLFICALAMGWICDSFSLFAGSLFGKRPLARVISPKKTVEGALGGIIGTAVFMALLCGIYAANAAEGSCFSGRDGLLYIAAYALIGALGAMCGILGDLTMSFAKRSAGIKNFGRIMPGHGGALDRMDSVLFTSIFARIAYGALFTYGIKA
ncbi:MAG: phosphatidate cytidylyltransferase [Oscillospiraceae bacterium]|nr:phosphatidate cytidylyltransferase [Oscillospiraceae bacterium]